MISGIVRTKRPLSPDLTSFSENPSTGTNKRIKGGVYGLVPDVRVPGRWESREIEVLKQPKITRRYSLGCPKDLEEIAKKYTDITISEEKKEELMQEYEKRYARVSSEISEQYPDRIFRLSRSDGKPSCFVFCSPCIHKGRSGAGSEVTFFPGRNLRVFCKGQEKIEAYEKDIDNLRGILADLKSRGVTLPGYPGGIQKIRIPQEVRNDQEKKIEVINTPGYSMCRHGPELRGVVIPKGTAPGIARQIGIQMKNLNDAGYIHLDLKSANICVARENSLDSSSKNAPLTVVIIDIGGAFKPENFFRSNLSPKVSPDHLPSAVWFRLKMVENLKECSDVLHGFQAFVFSALITQISYASRVGIPIAKIPVHESLPYTNNGYFALKSPESIDQNFSEAGFSSEETACLRSALERESGSYEKTTKLFGSTSSGSDMLHCKQPKDGMQGKENK